MYIYIIYIYILYYINDIYIYILYYINDFSTKLFRGFPWISHCHVQGFFVGGSFLRRDDTEVDGRLLFGDLLAAGFITPTLVIEVFFKTQAALPSKTMLFEDCGRLYYPYHNPFGKTFGNSCALRGFLKNAGPLIFLNIGDVCWGNPSMLGYHTF